MNLSELKLDFYKSDLYSLGVIILELLLIKSNFSLEHRLEVL